MANEFSGRFGSDVNVTLVPGTDGILIVNVDGEKVFDRKGEGGIYPDQERVERMKSIIREKLAAVSSGR